MAAPGLSAILQQTPEGIAEFDREYHRLLSMIKPIKYGNVAFWDAAATYTLAQYQVPRNTGANIVMRVENYTVNLTSGAADYGTFQPPPPGTAYWQAQAAGSSTTEILTDPNMQSHVMLDVDDFKIFLPGQNVVLVGDFIASPDGNERNVRTTVYSYNVTAELIERFGGITAIEPPSSGV